MKIKHLLVLALLPISILTAGLYAGYLYFEQKGAIIADVDHKLFTAANGYKFYTDPYHDRINDEHSLSDAEYREAMGDLAGFAERIGVQYAYSVIVFDGKIVFTSDSPTLEDMQNNDYTPFFLVYNDASEGLQKAIRDKIVTYEEYSDEWGPHRSIFLPATSKTGKEYVIGIDFSLVSVHQRLMQALLYAVLVGITGFALGLIPILLIARSITNPLILLSKTTEDIAKGNLDIALPPVRSGQELKKLSGAFENMKVALKEYIRNLAETTAAKERIESELKIARDIQMSLLPKKFPPFPERKDFEIHALLEPAREVGGDFYDFFLTDNDHLFFAVGDVSDKGVPAALFMAATRTLLKSLSTPEITLDSLLTKVNKELVEGNDSFMFVTLFCGKLDLRTGELTFTNAGHNPPLILRQNQTVNWLSLPPGLVLGVDPKTPYRCERTTLMPGETLLAYTDGVTEAMNNDKKPFSEDRLMEAVHGYANQTPREMIQGVSKSVTDYISSAPQSDDITLLAIRYRGAD